MAKLHFYYSAMNAGKSTTLLQSSYNYQERGMKPLLLKPATDTRYNPDKITSRVGLSESALNFTLETHLFNLIENKIHAKESLHCVFIDEAQFLSRAQVWQLTEIVDQLNLPVLAYGLRTDFKGELFEGSQYLLAWADNIIEIKTICHCGRKATMTLRTDSDGNALLEGDQIEIGGNNHYVSVCRKHFKLKNHC